ncbi:lysosomal cystine transporter [Ophiocordyceps camponoti-floridani]|uniref:Lysosomal cystine transporter n=1 Tax=Ophiocordyceps camponoti-floridani TaxID=2030778 RepID=A0A8H4VCL7_9HYPO|nr:lysosomal cystine transporter [Ophiocordyceps camponoti-floridani]
MEMASDGPDGFLRGVSGLFGWVYTGAWSASFYAQPVLNFRRGATSGSTVDFPFLNVLGFAAYLASNTALYYSPLIRAQYSARNHGTTPTVQFNDLSFALHALVLSSLTTSQYLLRRIWGFAPASGTRPSRFVVGIAGGCLVALLFTYVRVVTDEGFRGGEGGPRWLFADADPAAVGWCELDLVYAAGYVKLVITLVKYTPQIIANARNRSTAGWSIWQILLDVVGGVLSVAQQALDSYILRDWSGITGNPVKFALGNASLLYDSVFIAQHYVLYPEGDKRDERDPLLGEGGDDEESLRRRRRLD